MEQFLDFEEYFISKPIKHFCPIFNNF